MVRTVFNIAALAIATSVLAVSQHRTDPRTLSIGPRATNPAVLELYQSQGCSSCPPALDVLRHEADRPDIIALSFAVTYWDQLGWKDSFAQPAFTQRQWDYAHANGRGNVATPQLIINGRGFVNGGNRAEVDEGIVRYRIAGGPALAVRENRLAIAAAPTPRSATVWLVSYDPRTIDVPIRAGENDGRTLPHRNIVRRLEVLGRWIGPSQSYLLPAIRPGLARVILIQAGTGGPILAARRL